ncbi:hypothetical protein [Prevotella sp. 10(H)]|uniref:alpha-galactosidase n=1 Tax=Prevotella sp. 10(H) TaxID=1158294 RepID=UPI0004A6E57B|nr:hypothetical protein [Prevotella sp. 10(H)]
MKFKFYIVLIAVLSCIIQSCSQAESQFLDGGKWKIKYSAETKSVDYIYNGKNILTGVNAQALFGDVLLRSNEYEKAKIHSEDVNDNFGKGKKYIISYTSKDKPSLNQIFYTYPDKDYFFTEVKLSSNTDISTNYLAPIFTCSKDLFSDEDSNNMLFIPFDNDAWVRYATLPLDTSNLSFEATAIYNGLGRNGLIIGSVEHDIWKTGVKIIASENKYIDTLECFSGVTHKLTRDILSHGTIKGREVKSAKILVGYFNDWRTGMEEYGKANAAITPPRKWDKGTPFGWNSWGSMKQHVNYEGAKDVSLFIKENLQPKGFENNGTTIIDLDSFWDNFSREELKQFADYCKSHNQIPGIYWGPFADWGKNPEATVVGSLPYKYKDIYLYANGKPQDLDGAYAIDPTHPATQARIDEFMNIFHTAGFEYVKLDFVTHGALEADKHYDEKITTGIQAYNFGMQYVRDKAKDMFMALSIAPSFPSQYGHSKRIGCDAWGSINDTEYTLNGLTFGWWLNELYPYNDADHLVLDGFSDGENRARITSGVITGLYLLGDNFSTKGSLIGTLEARSKSLKYACNEEINKIARIGRSFKPVEGYNLSKKDGAETMFMLDTKENFYLAVFNYDNKDSVAKVDLKRLGLSKSNIKEIKELWSDKNVEATEEFLNYNLPPRDVCVFKFEKL